VSDGVKASLLAFTWPERTYELSNIQGKLLQGYLGSSSTTPLAEATLTLVAMISARAVDSTTTTEDGRFHFGQVSPGMYFLHVKAKEGRSYDPDGYIPIALNRAASLRSLDLTVIQTDCGLLLKP